MGVGIPSAVQPPQGLTRLVTDPTSSTAYHLDQETDARTAIARGIKEYLEQLSYNAFGGRLTKFQQVFDTWPQAEEKARYPAAAVIALGDGDYDASSLTPVAYETVEGLGLVKVAELKIDVLVMIYATDNKERANVFAMLEAALNPVDWMYGFRLEVPHYFSSRVTCEPGAMRYEDTQEDAIRRFRKGSVVVRCSTPVLNVSKLPFIAAGQPQGQVQANVQFAQPGGGISPVFSNAGAFLDLVPPTVTAFVVPATHVGTTIPVTTFSATDNVGVTGYMITESSTPPLPAAFGWTANRPTTFVAGGVGTRTLYAWAKDSAGNVSQPATATCVVS